MKANQILSSIFRYKIVNISGYAYALFGWAGDLLTKVYPTLYDDIVSADMKIYPPAYASLVIFVSFLTFIIGLIVGIPVIVLSSIMTLPAISKLGLIVLSIVAMFVLPFIVFIIFLFLPKIKVISRQSKFDLEIPYLSVYITVMATGGISPYVSFERLAKAPKLLFQEIRKEAQRFYLRVRAMGLDPLSAIEESAKRVPHNGYKQLMLGYAATLRAGGDVVHYLNRQTEIMLRDRISQIKTVGERIATLMEAYMAVVLLSSLTMYVLFVVNMALSQAGLGLGGGSMQFVLMSYIVMPMLSGLFIYLADIMQPKYPVYDKTPYYVYFGISLPITIFFFFAMVMPFIVPPPLSNIFKRIFLPFVLLIQNITYNFGMEQGYEAGVGMIIALAIGLIPAIIVETRSSLKYSGIQYGLTRFLRDLVEVRKTGMAPEKCIINLKDRDYGRFTKYLREIALQVGWGISLQKIFEKFSKGMKNWFALISMFLLVESIEVGGGTPRTLESLANYAETLEMVEKEKKSMMRPLMLIPYIGALIIVIVVLILVSFMRYILGFAGASISSARLVTMFLPPVIINSYLMGLVAGKISSERVAAGFKHAFLLLLANLFAMIITPSITVSLIPRL